MKLHIKIPGSGEINVEKEKGDPFGLYVILGTAAFLGFFGWMLWLMR